MSNYAPKYEQIFDYLSAPEYPTSPEPIVTFGRKDPIVAHKVGDLVVAGLAEIVAITGGIGKDSGNLLEEGYRTEAHYLGVQLGNDLQQRMPNTPHPHVLLEEKASNGGENARHSLVMLSQGGVSVSALTAVTHATSNRRLSETLKFEAQKMTGTESVVHRVPSD